MGQWYEVQFAQPTGFTDNFGNVSHNVKFVTESDPVLWAINPAKTTLDAGMKVYGRIDNVPTKKDPSKTYRKFVREQPDEPGQTTNTQKRTYSATQTEKTDSIVQGRCYNNAATLVAALVINGAIEPDSEKIAQATQGLATALYALPPLVRVGAVEATPTQDTVYTPTDEEMNQPMDLSALDTLFPGNVKS